MKDDLLDILLTYECPFTGAKRVAGLGAVKQELGQGRGGAWDHRRCGTCFFTAMALPSSKVVPLTIACLCLSGLPSLKGVNGSAAAPPRELSRATQATAFCFSERLSLPFARPDTFPRAPNPSNPSAGLSKATLAATRHGHPVFKGVQACRLPGPKPFKPSRRPFEGNSRSYTPRPSVFKGVQACRLPGLQTLTQAFRRQLSQLHATAICYFEGVQACRLPGPKPFKPSRKPFEGNSRNCTPGFKPFLRPFQGNSEPAVARLQTLPQAFPRQLSQLQGATRTVEVTRAICFTVCHGPSVLARAISFSCTVSQRACHA